MTDLFSRFWRDEPNPPPKRRHHVLQVQVESELYLCDVGVGGIVPRRPIKMVENLVQQQGDEYYRLEKDPYYGWMLCERKKISNGAAYTPSPKNRNCRRILLWPHIGVNTRQNQYL